jgi:murein DD-endopeptidase MepM/ murein hydrolase activator NlpD
MKFLCPHGASHLMRAFCLATFLLASGGLSQALAVPRNPCCSGEHASLYQPTFGKVISRFGFWKDPATGHVTWNAGIGYLVQPGALLRAAGLGRVSRVGGKDPGNLFIAIDHGRGIEVLYAHLRRTDHDVGRCVRAGEILGEAGQQNPVPGGQALHIQVRRNGVLVDPSQFLLPYLPLSGPPE